MRTHPLWIERSVTFFYGNEVGPGVNAVFNRNTAEQWEKADRGR